MEFKPIINNKPASQTKVVVAMSGGVDSSFVASTLHNAGYEVIGITLQLYKPNNPSYGSCCTGADIEDARNVSSTIGFPHYVLNYEKTFKNEVIDYFIDSYQSGETPIPCVKCNQTVKFRDLLRFTKEIGADALVTGHYARTESNNGTTSLLKAVDDTKDQSYFLFTTTKKQLEYIRFPLGDYTKQQVREAAKEMGLLVADKPDSQDICFVQNKYTELFAHHAKKTSGSIVHTNGIIVGQHEGIEQFTIGQRRGIGISWKDPLYVIKINKKDNTITVGEESSLLNEETHIHNQTWVSGEPPKDNQLVTAKLRASHKGDLAHITKVNEDISKITFIEQQKAITPGQACVLYDGDYVLGGGWICNFPNNNPK